MIESASLVRSNFSVPVLRVFSRPCSSCGTPIEDSAVEIVGRTARYVAFSRGRILVARSIVGISITGIGVAPSKDEGRCNKWGYAYAFASVGDRIFHITFGC